ncbi:hypothetical protein JCM19992_01950 [Thermostilla marina]
MTARAAVWSTALAMVLVAPCWAGQAAIEGELKTWHKVTLSWRGPQASETGDPNPFADYRLTVTFTHPESGTTLVVPGYFAADGKAADTSAEAGNVWRAHLAPPKAGRWTYRVDFRTGKDVAVADDPEAGKSAGFFDGDTGEFTIAPTDKTGRDHRAKGLLEYVGKHHLRFAGNGEWFLKAGADAPENLFAYDDFDGTPNVNNRRKSWQPHAKDFDAADAGRYTWANGKGTELLGAIKYLHDEGLNAFSFLTFSLDGDDDNVFPHRLVEDEAAYEALPDNRRWEQGGVYHDRFDVSKLAQWERIYEYGDKLGMFLHFKTMETENELKMDGGDLGRERKLYYRELVARFGHHLALNWNLGEEINNATTAQKQAWAAYLHEIDPYKHHIVIHNGAPHYDLMGPYDPEKGTGSELTGFSLQTNKPDFVNVFPMTLNYLRRSDAAGKPWVVACDEPGDASHALRPAGDEGNSWEDGRKNALWGNLMAGGMGVEFYFGYKHAHSDLTCQDWRSRDGFWDYCRYALQFFKNNDVPFQDMANHNELVGDQAWCLAKPGAVYVVYLRNGGTAELDLSDAEGTFTVRWYDPRSGGALQTGAVESVPGGKKVVLGKAPHDGDQDWVVLVRK